MKLFRMPFIFLIETVIKEILFFFFAAGHLLRGRQEKYRGKRKLRGVLLSQEFYSGGTNFFGGFGVAAGYITGFYSSGDGWNHIDPVLVWKSGVTHPDGAGNGYQVVNMPPLLKLIFGSWDLKKILRKNRPDYILSIDYLTKYEYVLWMTLGIPTIIYIRDPRSRVDWERISTVPQEIEANYRRNKKDLIRIAKQHRRSMDRVNRWNRVTGGKIIYATNAPFLIGRAREKFGNKSIEPYFLPTPIPDSGTDDIIYGKQPMLLSLARLDPQKRPWIIFELAKRMPDVDFVLAGITRFPHLLEPVLVQYKDLPNLKLTGIVLGKDKEDLLNKCWGLINTSIHEALPVSFLETFSYGKPVISCLNPDGLVERYGYYTGESLGMGTDQRTLDNFIEVIGKCISDKEDRKQKGLAARKYVSEIYSYDNFDRQLKKIFVAEGLLNGPEPDSHR